MIAMEISRIVDEMGHSVCGTAARHADAVAIAATSHPALVLADIQLKDGDSGIAAVQEILQDWGVPIIFVTGYPERLLTGERVEPRSEEHTSEIQSLIRISYAGFCL